MRDKYKKNYIKESLIRIDFGVPIEELKTSINPELNKIILDSFKIYEPENVQSQEVVINNGSVNFNTKEETNYRYFGKNKEKFINIGHSFIIVVYKKYESFEKRKEELSKILEKMSTLYKEFQIRRIGVRYINEIEMIEKEITDWKDYINKDLISMLSFPENSKQISRAMSSIELNFDQYKLRFQYGMFNPDYPAPVKRKQFILDYDAYYEGYIDTLREIFEFIDKAHEKIIELFERSIEEGLRKKMQEEE